MRCIGTGGMAQIYLAERNEDQRKLAIKILNCDNDELNEAVQRFAAEYRVLENLHHKHVLKVYEQGKIGDALFIAMEYFEGGDLAQRIPPHGMSLIEAWRVLREITSALVEVHRLHIIHRDIKPDNILFRADGHSVLTDFGIAKQMDALQAMTAVGFVLGTPYFMSPEQITGKTLDGRTDIYSVGGVFYTMLTGHEPYRGTSMDAIVMQHLNSPIPTLPTASQFLQPLLENMMAKKAEHRYHAHTLLQAITKIETDQPALR